MLGVEAVRVGVIVVAARGTALIFAARALRAVAGVGAISGSSHSPGLDDWSPPYPTSKQSIKSARGFASSRPRMTPVTP